MANRTSSARSCAACVATRAQAAGAEKPALLIVDDDVLIADTLTFALGADFEVLACESRAHAIELLRQLPQPPLRIKSIWN